MTSACFRQGLNYVQEKFVPVVLVKAISSWNSCSRRASQCHKKLTCWLSQRTVLCCPLADADSPGLWQLIDFPRPGTEACQPNIRSEAQSPAVKFRSNRAQHQRMRFEDQHQSQCIFCMPQPAFCWVCIWDPLEFCLGQCSCSA